MALPRFLHEALLPDPAILLSDSTRLTQTQHADSWIPEGTVKQGVYVRGDLDANGHVSSFRFLESVDGSDAMRVEWSFGWSPLLPATDLKPFLGSAAPAYEVNRGWKGDSLLGRDSSWSLWDPASRTVLVRSSGDTSCPWKDSVVLDAASRPILRKECREGSVSTDISGTWTTKDVRFWGLYRFEYRSSEDTLPWREEDWRREGDNGSWQLDDSGSTVGDPDRPVRLTSRFGTVLTLDYDLQGRLSQARERVADSVQWSALFDYDAQGRLIREITTESVSDTVTWSYAQAVPQAIRQRRASGLTVVRAQDGLNVLGEDVLESRLLDVQGKVLWSQGRGNHLVLPEGRSLTILQVVTRSGLHSWTIPAQP